MLEEMLMFVEDLWVLQVQEAYQWRAACQGPPGATWTLSQRMALPFVSSSPPHSPGQVSVCCSEHLSALTCHPAEHRQSQSQDRAFASQQWRPAGIP